MKTPRPLAAVAVLALALPLAACSSDKSKDADSTSSATATTATAMASTDAMADSNSAASADGQKVTASTAGISFLVPSDWTVISDPSNLDEDVVEAAAKAVGQDPATYKASMKHVDLLVSSQEAKAIGSLPYADNIIVARQTFPKSQVPTDERSASEFAKATGASSMTKYEKISTTNGEATVVHYEVTVKDGTGYGAVVFAPTSEGSHAAITVTATEASMADKLAAQVTSSVK
ncbi:hypothetical protein ABXS69_10350 [Actinomyces timonensis]|uniref:Lipoprotein n=1 Tax=Actinomyces timonensis TaxID=1288391 RepID=A0AAU8N0N7_9ACTO